MSKKTSKFLMLIVLLFVATASALMARTLECLILVDGIYVSGTIYSNEITVDVGPPTVATFTPPWAIVTSDGIVLGASGDVGGSAIIRLPNQKAALLSEANVTFSDISGVNISSKQPLSVSIYDITGNLIYSATERTDLQISAELLSDNAYYVLRLMDKEGNVSNCNFMLSNGTMFYNSNK